MKTVSHKTESLILFNRNQNGASFNSGDQLWMKEHYFNVFYKIYETLKATADGLNPKIKSMVKLWTDVNNDEILKLKTRICECNWIKENNISKEELIDSVNKITHKFRGNLGEIFFEYILSFGFCPLIKGKTYEPVDPGHEQYVDAIAMHIGDDLPVGIQIKNYNNNDFNNKDEMTIIHREVFTKAQAQSLKWLIGQDSKISKEDRNKFLDSPHQIIVCVNAVRPEMIDEEPGVMFYGNKWVDSLNLQGSKKDDPSPKWAFFKEIADEIEKFNG